MVIERGSPLIKAARVPRVPKRETMKIEVMAKLVAERAEECPERRERPSESPSASTLGSTSNPDDNLRITRSWNARAPAAASQPARSPRNAAPCKNPRRTARTLRMCGARRPTSHPRSPSRWPARFAAISRPAAAASPASGRFQERSRFSCEEARPSASPVILHEPEKFCERGTDNPVCAGQ